jgi:hypothetical protein
MGAGSSAWLERSTDNRKVGSSNPPRPTISTFSGTTTVNVIVFCLPQTLMLIWLQYLELNIFHYVFFAWRVSYEKIQGTKLRIDEEKTKKNKSGYNMPIVKCGCGVRILVVPDLVAMDKAIKNHLVGHKGANGQFLVEQILNATSKQVLHEF